MEVPVTVQEVRTVISVESAPRFYLPTAPAEMTEIIYRGDNTQRHTDCTGVLNVYRAEGRLILWVSTEPGEEPSTAKCWGRLDEKAEYLRPKCESRGNEFSGCNGRWVHLEGIRQDKGSYYEWQNQPYLEFLSP